MYNDPNSGQTVPGSYPQFPPPPSQFNQSPYPQQYQSGPGQFGPPMQQQKPPKPPLFDFKARRAYFKQYPPSKKQKLVIGCGTLIGVLLLCGVCAAIGNASNATKQPATAQVSSPTAVTHQATLINPTAPPPTPTPSPTPTQPPMQQPAQQQQPAAPPPSQPQQPAPAPATGVNGNPWGYDFNPGSKIYAPNAEFCNGVYFSCVTTFWKDTNGYVVKCGNGEYSHSGGVSGACSKDGGVAAILYSH